MRKLLIGVALSVAFAGAAMASDYIVVNSTDASIKRGQSFDAGARVALGAGQSLTLMRASGEVTTLRGAAGGVAVPGARLASADAARFETLRALVQPPPEGRTARRCRVPDQLDHGTDRRAWSMADLAWPTGWPSSASSRSARPSWVICLAPR